MSRVGVDPGGRLLFCHGSDNTVELFAICGAEEVRRRCQKRARKERRKARAANSNEEAVDDVTVPEPTIQVGDFFLISTGWGFSSENSVWADGNLQGEFDRVGWELGKDGGSSKSKSTQARSRRRCPTL